MSDPPPPSPAPRNNHSSSTPRDTVFRLLVDARLAGTVIGKAGAGIGAIRAETGARVRVIDALPAAEERVAVVSSRHEPGADADAAQHALLRLHDAHAHAAAAVAAASAGGVVVAPPPPPPSARLLVCRSQAGALIGREGKALADLRDATGARVLVHPAADAPPVALATDRLVTIDGAPAVGVRNALARVAAVLRAHPPALRPGGAVAGEAAAPPPSSSLSPAGMPPMMMMGWRPLPPHSPGGYGVPPHPAAHYPPYPPPGWRPPPPPPGWG